MTNNPNAEFTSRIFSACRQFYRAFDFMPERIVICWRRKPHFAPYLNLPILPSSFPVPSSIDEIDEGPKQFFASIPVETYNKFEWEDFALRSAKTGTIFEKDLNPSAELVKRIIESRGYKVLISETNKSEFFDAFYVFNDDMYKFFVFAKIDYTEPYNPIDTIKAEIDYTLNKFLT